MFEPSARKVEHKIRKLEEDIIHIDNEIKRVTARMKELSGTFILPKYQHLYSKILGEIDEISEEITKVARKIGMEKLEILHNTPGRGVIDISGVDPALIRRYLSLQKRMNELIKQEAHLERLSDVDKQAQLRADGFYIAELNRKKNKDLKELTGLNKAKR
ncbi:MAG: hypothetical protein J7K73_02890 [Nanoarchaeota archaeon]|nr:hypothetical protein [Nanoarchaeota archaeon]